MRNLKSYGLLALSLGMSLGSSLQAEPARRDYLCALSRLYECSAEHGCAAGKISQANLPPFVEVDLDAMLIRSHGGAEEQRQSKILHLEENAGTLLAQGMENGRAWGFAMHLRSQAFTMSAVESDRVFVVSGHCTNR